MLDVSEELMEAMGIGLPVRESKGRKSSSSIEDVLSLSGESSPTGLSLLKFVRRGELSSSPNESPSLRGPNGVYNRDAL